MTLSLALLRVGEAAKALEVINSTRITDWNNVPAGWQLIRAGVLKANGQPVPEVKDAMLALREERALVM